MSLFNDPVRGHDKLTGEPILLLGLTTQRVGEVQQDYWLIMLPDGSVNHRSLADVTLDWRWDDEHESGTPGWNDLAPMLERQRPGEPEV